MTNLQTVTIDLGCGETLVTAPEHAARVESAGEALETARRNAPADYAAYKNACDAYRLAIAEAGDYLAQALS